ncbi:MAG: hypothetical protein WC455_13930 [Dehalococcoidia bacterium]
MTDIDKIRDMLRLTREPWTEKKDKIMLDRIDRAIYYDKASGDLLYIIDRK